jgi:hypothetical protein
MHEAVLRDFFLGDADSAQLRADLQGGVVKSGIVRQHRIVDMTTDMLIELSHLVRLCDVVLAGELQPDALQQIGFCLIASDAFHWDGDTVDGAVIAETVYDWSCPEINWPLTQDNVRKFREGLIAGKYVFRKENPINKSPQPTGADNVVSQDIKV